MIKRLGLTITEWWLVGGVVLVSLLVELAALVWRDTLPLITTVGRANGQLWSIWPFLAGFVPAHIYSPSFLRIEALQRAQPVTLPVILATVLVFDFIVRRTTADGAFNAYALGALCGLVFWNTAP